MKGGVHAARRHVKHMKALFARKVYSPWNPYELQAVLVAVGARYLFKVALHFLLGKGLSPYENELIEV